MMTFNEFMATFPNETVCRQYLVDRRWPKGVTCPRCGNEKVYGSKARPFTWQCMKCGPGPRKPYRFSVLVGTVFENTNYPLKTWFEVLWSMLNAKKGISAAQIHRQIGCKSYETAWYVCMRLRAGMHDDDFKKLMGIVEVDETFVGGKDANRHWNKKSHATGGIASGKVGVIGAISRKGNVVAKVIENTDTATLSEFVNDVVSDKVDLVATDEAKGYEPIEQAGWALGRPALPHGTVKHSEHEYVRGEVHTNDLESFWSLLKRGIIGNYHHVSKKYLPLYLNEFSFRHNNRKNSDMFGLAIAGC
jgi:transposase-like protein